MGRHHVTVAPGLAVLLLVAACSSPSPAPSTGSASPGPTDPGASVNPGQTNGPSPTEPAPGEAWRGIVLSEVGFAHDDEPAFIELWNAGEAPADLREMGVAVDGTVVPVAFPDETLAADARSLLRFDLVVDPALGVSVDPGSAHASPTAGPAIRGGTLDLLDAYGRPLDHVAWGSEPDAVRTGLGGMVPDALDPAWTIGRAPGNWAAGDRQAWVPYGPGEATPGGPNPLPAVPVILPLSGAIFDSPQVDLTWYPAQGATAYRVQLATDQGFGAIVRDETLATIGLVIDGLGSGTYWWRVQALGEGGLSAQFAGPATFEVVAGVASAPTGVARGGVGSIVLAAVEAPAARSLNVPLLSQAKDSPMLLLERNVRLGPHPWDGPHGRLDENDPADNMNCALASTAMFSAFACPNCKMSQDRIGYEIFKARLPGPERDLNYGDGLTADRVTAAIEFALVGSRPVETYSEVPDTVWATLRGQIDAGRPVVVGKTHATGGHVFIITGYAVVAGKRTVFANDPWSGPKTYSIATSAAADPSNGWYMWPTSGPLLGRQQELSVTTDTDGDGVYDFDETERFHTDPDQIDSDDDGVGDKEDVASSVFDASYGYAVVYRKDAVIPRMDGRDFDRDGMPPERDPDSDQGGCKDGDEDVDLLGDHDPDETWNFDAGDDPCQPANGTLTWTSNFGVGSTESWQRLDQRLEVTVRLKPNPEDPTRWFLNDGSTYQYVGRGRGYVRGLAGCDDFVEVINTGGGQLAAEDLAGSIMVEYEPGRDAFEVSVSASWQGHGRHWNCLYDEPLSQQDTFSPAFDCAGFEDTDDGNPSRTFVFNCSDGLGAGWFGYTWSLTGSITIR